MFDDLLRNRFVQSLGVGALLYLTLLGMDWIILLLLEILETISRGYKYYVSPYSLQIAITGTLLYLLWSAVFSSRPNP